MITLRPGASPSNVLKLLEDAHWKLNDAQGGVPNTTEVFLKYLQWANTYISILGPFIGKGDIDRLIMTKRYWTLQGIVEPTAHRMIRPFIDLEISERIKEFESEIRDLNYMLSRWSVHDNSSLVALVLDTNVLLDHHEELASFDWATKVELRSNVPIVLSIPLAVIDELDRLKRDNLTRTRARQALRTLDKHLEKPGEWFRLKQQGSEGSIIWSDLYLSIIVDEPGHVPLTHVDSEIVDRALTLEPFARDVFIATYDTGMALRARQANLKVCKFD